VRNVLKLLSNLMFWKSNRKVRFKPGERVRISSYEKIKETLDERNCYESLIFMESMAKFCGRDYEVLREVKWLYDEYSMKMLRCKDIVVLKDLVCDGKGILGGKDCGRSCPYIWKKTWLEKA
jgi:predicted DNA-binding antitoxin AbrB/MazE fold protein